MYINRGSLTGNHTHSSENAESQPLESCIHLWHVWLECQAFTTADLMWALVRTAQQLPAGCTIDCTFLSIFLSLAIGQNNRNVKHSLTCIKYQMCDSNVSGSRNIVHSLYLFTYYVCLMYHELNQVTLGVEGSTMSGSLQRRKKSKRKWKRLWFLLKDKVLYTFTAREVRGHRVSHTSPKTLTHSHHHHIRNSSQTLPVLLLRLWPIYLYIPTFPPGQNTLCD